MLVFLEPILLFFIAITPPTSWEGYVIGAVCFCVCERDYCKSNQPISLTLGAVRDWA